MISLVDYCKSYNKVILQLRNMIRNILESFKITVQHNKLFSLI